MPLHEPDAVQTIEQELTACPSCSRDVSGNYCQHCGERTLSNKPDLRFSHFLEDAYHEFFDLDSKFIKTLKYLFLRPGFLTLEWLKGKRNLYIKPFRLYVTLVVLHFLAFSAFQSGDIFNVDRFPAMKFSPLLRQVIREKETSQQTSHAEFTAALNQKVKDNLSIALYLVVFLEAVVLTLLYKSFNRYYVEHLNFVFHIFSFAFARNVFMIPLVMLDQIAIAIVFVVGTQLLYTFLALKNVYAQGNLITTVKFITLMVSVMAMFYMAFHICVFIALKQIS